MRHGATPWNAGGRFQGSSDVGLSEVGIAQAGAISRRLKNESIDRVYTSDLSRALETARAVAGFHGIEPLPDARLREFDFGDWEGLTWHEIASRHPELRDATDARTYAPPGGETFAAVRERVRAFLNDLARDGPAHAVVVTHAGPLHAILAELQLTTPQRQPARFSPAGITDISLDAGGAVLLRFDDVSHLEESFDCTRFARSTQDDNA